MAYNYLDLVNEVAERCGEVTLTSANFGTQKGSFYKDAKRSINSSLKIINRKPYEWPWNWATEDEALVVGTNRYAYETNTKFINYRTFRIRGTTSNDTYVLDNILYEEYIDKYVRDEYESGTGHYDMPKKVARTPNRGFVLWPIPDDTYTLTYEYFTVPVELSAYDDVPTLPEQFRHVIVDGAMYYAERFRNNFEAAGSYRQDFKEGIKDMRTLYVNRRPHVETGYIERQPYEPLYIWTAS